MARDNNNAGIHLVRNGRITSEPKDKIDKYGYIIAEHNLYSKPAIKNTPEENIQQSIQKFESPYQTVGLIVHHKKYGQGIVVAFTESTVDVQFQNEKVIALDLLTCFKLNILSIVDDQQNKDERLVGVADSNGKTTNDETENTDSIKNKSVSPMRSKNSIQMDYEPIQQEVQLVKRLQNNVSISDAIFREISSFFPNDDIHSAILSFENIIKEDIAIEELAGVKDTQLHILQEIFDEDTTYKEIKSYLSGALKVEALLKKILYFYRPDKLNNIISNKKGFIHVLFSLNLIDRNVDIHAAPQSFSNQVISCVVRSYQLRNSDAHLCKNWNYSDTFINLDSILVTCIYAILKNKIEVVRNEILSEIDMLKENYDLTLWEKKGQEQICSECDVYLGYSESINLDYVYNLERRKYFITGKFCPKCGKIYIVKDILIHVIDNCKLNNKSLLEERKKADVKTRKKQHIIYKTEGD